ncbi:uncharacterized protein KD926_007395 [Aspergillus affinis]|uniref:uncharacterized protein n=1 Tax=Aspergillus affinis TaxID=1070780 RepID=UPI0022FE0A31|nr:uncharacterized protein KD926_007395 [Aspergillus affinis]KAI9041125.1 hypothetical protein KD926_007395 [Aspergillus affinis]
MPVPIQIIHIHYRGKLLNLLDSDNQTPLYRVKVGSHSPQMELFRVEHNHLPSESQGTPFSTSSVLPICTATFKIVSLQVKLKVRGQEVQLERESLLTRTYNFHSSVANVDLTWTADGALTGDYQLSVAHGGVVARFRNRLFSNQEVGTFELVGDIEDRFLDEIVISGLAMLAMVQSLNLAGMLIELAFRSCPSLGVTIEACYPLCFISLQIADFRNGNVGSLPRRYAYEGLFCNLCGGIIGGQNEFLACSPWSTMVLDANEDWHRQVSIQGFAEGRPSDLTSLYFSLPWMWNRFYRAIMHIKWGLDQQFKLTRVGMVTPCNVEMVRLPIDYDDMVLGDPKIAPRRHDEAYLEPRSHRHNYDNPRLNPIAYLMHERCWALMTRILDVGLITAHLREFRQALWQTRQTINMFLPLKYHEEPWWPNWRRIYGDQSFIPTGIWRQGSRSLSTIDREKKRWLSEKARSESKKGGARPSKRVAVQPTIPLTQKQRVLRPIWRSVAAVVLLPPELTMVIVGTILSTRPERWSILT